MSVVVDVDEAATFALKVPGRLEKLSTSIYTYTHKTSTSMQNTQSDAEPLAKHMSEAPMMCHIMKGKLL
jgi:hypothetical protein